MTQAPRAVSTYVAHLVQAMRQDAPLYVLAGVFLAFGMLHLVNSQHSVWGMLGHYLAQWSFHFGLAGPFVALTAGIIHIAWRMKGRKRLAYRAMVAPRRLARFVAGTIFLMTAGLMFMTTFTALKTGLSDGGFPYDRLHADIDKALHFGVDPFRYLYSFAQYPWLLRLLELNYSIVWFVICYFALYIVMTSPRTDTMRLRFGFTWLGCWIIVGTAMAGQWLSAGPVYYGHITGDTARFADQVAFLSSSAGAQASAHNFQHYLWALHQSGQGGLGSGISAFPSMHVGLVTVVALFAGERSLKLGLLAWGYVALIQFSSVYLGWHYAIDGYASVLTVTALYWALRRLVPTFARLRWRSPAGSLALDGH